MNLTGRQFEYLQDTLLSVFRNQAQLEQMVRIELDENLNAIASGDNLTDIVFGLVRWAEQHNRINDLIDAAVRTIPTNLELQKLKADADGWSAYTQRPNAVSKPLSRNARSRRDYSVQTITALLIIAAIIAGVFFYSDPLNWLDRSSDAYPDAEATLDEITSEANATVAGVNISVAPSAANTNSPQVDINKESSSSAQTEQSSSTPSSDESIFGLSTISSNITNNPGESKSPRLFVDVGGNVHLFHHDNTPRQGAEFDILHRQRLPGGDWSDETNLTEAMDILSIRPAYPLINAANIPCVSWWGQSVWSAPATGGMFMSCYENMRWTKEKQIDDSLLSIPAFTDEGFTAVLDEVRPNSIQINDFELADGFQNTMEAQFVIDSNGTFHVTWMRVGDPISIEHRLSGDGGLSWSEPFRLADRNVTAEYELEADKNGNVHFVWGNGSIFYRAWTPQDGWDDATELSRGGGQDVRLAIDEAGTVHTIWRNLYEIVYTKQIGANEWAVPAIVAKGVNNLGTTDIAVDHSDTVYIAWQDDTDSQDIYITELSHQSSQ